MGRACHSWCCMLVSPRCCWLSLLSVVHPLLLFIIVHRSLVLHRWHLASLVWGGVQWQALAVNCHWAVDGGRIELVGRVGIEEGEGDLLHSLSMTMMTPSSSSLSALSTLPCHLPCAREFVCGSMDRGPRASSIRGWWWSLLGSGPRSWVLVVIVRWS